MLVARVEEVLIDVVLLVVASDSDETFRCGCVAIRFR